MARRYRARLPWLHKSSHKAATHHLKALSIGKLNPRRRPEHLSRQIWACSRVKVRRTQHFPRKKAKLTWRSKKWWRGRKHRHPLRLRPRRYREVATPDKPATRRLSPSTLNVSPWFRSSISTKGWGRAERAFRLVRPRAASHRRKRVINTGLILAWVRFQKTMHRMPRLRVSSVAHAPTMTCVTCFRAFIVRLTRRAHLFLRQPASRLTPKLNDKTRAIS